jgi:hypothetical protein
VGPTLSPGQLQQGLGRRPALALLRGRVRQFSCCQATAARAVHGFESGRRASCTDATCNQEHDDELGGWGQQGKGPRRPACGTVGLPHGHRGLRSASRVAAPVSRQALPWQKGGRGGCGVGGSLAQGSTAAWRQGGEAAQCQDADVRGGVGSYPTRSNFSGQVTPSN